MIHLQITTPARWLRTCARILTLCVLITQAGCSIAYIGKQETCTTRAYIRTPLNRYLNARFDLNAPVRMGIIPFATQANISAWGRELHGLGIQMASTMKNEFLRTGEVPIVELMNRQDWPAKKEEFHAGNFTSIEMARNAGYDLVLTGLLENITEMNELTLQTKVIEVASGMTVWSGKTTIETSKHEYERSRPIVWFKRRRADKLDIYKLSDELVMCAIDEILLDEEVPE